MTTIHDSLTKAIAEAREALAKYQDRDARHYLDEAMEGLLAAIDAQEPVAWGLRDGGTGAIIDCICPDEHDRTEGDYTVPLYLAPAAPPAAVPAGWNVESLGPLDVRVTSPSGEKWRLSDDDQLSGFFYRFTRAMLAAARKGE